MNKFEGLIETLENSVKSGTLSKEDAFFFEATVGNEELECSDEKYEILAELAHDFAFYQPDKSLREGEPSLFGNVEAIRKIEATLRRLRPNT